MANRFYSPDQQFADSTGAALSGAQLFFYTAGTSTKLNTYSDKALSVANTNPVVLDSSGRAGSIFLQNLAYKVVLAPSTDTDPPTSPIWTIDNVWTSDFSGVAQFNGNNGNPNGAVAGTQGSAGVPASVIYDYTNKILYVCTTTGNAASAVWTAINPAATNTPDPVPAGRLTLQTATPVMNSDQIGASIVYYTPYVGSTIPIYNGSTFVPTVFTEQTLTLNNPGHAANTIYDVFIWNNSGTVSVATGPAWSNSAAGSGARGSGASTTQLTMISGHLVNAVSITGRNGGSTNTIGANLATYVGSIFIDATAGQVTCHFNTGQNRKFGIWNAFNRVPITLGTTDTTASWTYSTATFRASNNTPASFSGTSFNVGSGTTTNGIIIFTGLAEETTPLFFVQNVLIAGTTQAFLSMGVNSVTSAATVQSAYLGSTTSARSNVSTFATYGPNLGVNVIVPLEKGSSNTTFFAGGGTDMLLQGTYRG